MRILLYVFLGLSFLSCVPGQKSEESNKAVLLAVGDTVYNEYAQAFRIIHYDDYVQLDIIDPLLDSVLYQYGIGNNVPGSLNDLGSEIESIAALSSTHVGMIRALNLSHRITGVSYKKYLCDTTGTSQWVNFGELGQADPELYVANKPNLIMYSGFKLDVPVLKKLREIGIPSLVNYDWKETHPLGRAEWLKVFGILFNKESEAKLKFGKIKDEYMGIVKFIQNAPNSPSVLVGTLYGDVFNVPAGESYMSTMLTDANVKYKYSNTEGTGSLNISLEEVVTTNRSTDFWLNVAASSKQEVLNMNANFTMLDAFQEDRIFTYFNDVNCFWEESAVAPQKVLYDLIHIFHPSQFEQSNLHYYDKIN